VRALGRPGDVLVAISTSGDSPNVLAAVGAARELRLRTIALTGGTGGALSAQCEYTLLAPATATASIQEAHTAILHALCAVVDQATSESALLHALDAREGSDPELVVFLQATSPVRTGEDIDAAVRLLREQGADSLFSACRDHGLFWLETAAGPEPQNYQPATR